MGFPSDYWNATPSTFLTFVGLIDGFTKRFATLGFFPRTLQIGPAGVPDGGSTFSLLSFALLGVAVPRRKLRW